MDKRSLYDGLNSLETDLDSSVTQLREIKAALHELVEKNTTLEIENQRLREHLQELNKLAGNTTETEKQELSKSRMNLENFMKRASMSAIFYMVQDVKMMKNVPFVLMLFMGNVRVKSSGTLQIKRKGLV